MRIFTRIGWGSMAAEQEPGPIRSTKTGSGRSQRSAGPVSGEPPRILIVGGGFVGMYTARYLRRRLRRGEAVVMLVDPRGFMTFQPFLAEAAAGTIEPRHAVASPRRVLPGTEVLTGRITRIDHAARRACFQPQDGTAYSLSYDVLVLVAGSVSRTLPIPGLAENAVGFKNLAEAIHLRNHVLAQLDNAASVQDPQQRQRALTFVVVGGGFAGVEAPAELQAMAARILADWAISMFFHADAIPLSDLEHPEQELMRRRTSSNPRGTSDDASRPGHRPAHPVRSI